LKYQYATVIADSRMYLCEGDIEQSLLEELTHSDQISFSDSSVTEDLTVSNVIGVEYSDN
jgi:hypothetical protein